MTKGVIAAYNELNDGKSQLCVKEDQSVVLVVNHGQNSGDCVRQLRTVADYMKVSPVL